MVRSKRRVDIDEGIELEIEPWAAAWIARAIAESEVEVEVERAAGLHRGISPDEPFALPFLRSLSLETCMNIGAGLRGAELPRLETLRIQTNLRVGLVDGLDTVTDRWTALLNLLPSLPLMARLQRLVLWRGPADVIDQLRERILERHGHCPELECTAIMDFP